jgi:ATP-dependent Clp protease adapter protein ClpS
VPDMERTSALSFVNVYADRMKRTPRKPISVLVVDDEPSVLEFVACVLSEAG